MCCGEFLRRALRFGKLLGIDDLFLHKLTAKTVELYQDPYRELRDRSEYIEKIVTQEERRFGETLEQGLQILEDYLAKFEKTGEKAFPAISRSGSMIPTVFRWN